MTDEDRSARQQAALYLASPAALVVVYVVLVLNGIFGVLSGDISETGAIRLLLHMITLAALLLVAGSWARIVGISASVLQIVIGLVAIAFGVVNILVLNVFAGLFLIAVSLVFSIGLGFWTIHVLLQIGAAQRASAAAGNAGPDRATP